MKIQYFINVSFCLFLLWTVVACEKEGVDEQDIEVPEGYALSAGISTIFLNSSKAYDTPADWLSGNYASRFNRGDKLYDDVRRRIIAMAEDWDQCMRGIPAVAVTVMPAVPGLRFGVAEDREVMGSRRCWYISAERTELFFRITDGFCMTRQFMG